MLTCDLHVPFSNSMTSIRFLLYISQISCQMNLFDCIYQIHSLIHCRVPQPILSKPPTNIPRLDATGMIFQTPIINSNCIAPGILAYSAPHRAIRSSGYSGVCIVSVWGLINSITSRPATCRSSRSVTSVGREIMKRSFSNKLRRRKPPPRRLLRHAAPRRGHDHNALL